MPSSMYLGALTVEDRAKLEQRLVSRQSGRCFICDDPLDLVLQKGQLDVDHIDPLAEDGLDAKNNFALTHQSCNRSKGAAKLHVARRIKEFERLQEQAQKEGKRGANLGDVQARYGGAMDQGRPAGGALDAAVVSPVPSERGQAAAERARVTTAGISGGGWCSRSGSTRGR